MIGDANPLLSASLERPLLAEAGTSTSVRQPLPVIQQPADQMVFPVTVGRGLHSLVTVFMFYGIRQMTGLAERSARMLISKLAADRLLVSDSMYAPARF